MSMWEIILNKPLVPIRIDLELVAEGTNKLDVGHCAWVVINLVVGRLRIGIHIGVIL